MIAKPIGLKVYRAQRQAEKRAASAKALAARRRLEWDAEATVRTQVWRRDGGKCRASGVPVFLSHSDPFKVAHCHHVVYRSAGGLDVATNRVTLSLTQHDLVHRHLLTLELGPSGDAGQPVRFLLRDSGGGILKDWEG